MTTTAAEATPRPARGARRLHPVRPAGPLRRRARPSSTRRARWAWTSTRSAAGGASAAAARSARGSARSRSSGSRPRPITCRRRVSSRRPIGASMAWRPDRRLSCTASAPRRRPDRRAAREPGPSPGGAQEPGPARVRGRPGRPAPLRRGGPTRARLAHRRPRPAVRGPRARVGADRPGRGPGRDPGAPAGPGRGRLPGHRGRPRWPPGDGDLARPPRSSLRRRDRRRLDHDRRPPGRPGRRLRSSPRTA